VIEPISIELQAGFGVAAAAGIQKLVSESSGSSGRFPRRNSSWFRPLRRTRAGRDGGPGKKLLDRGFWLPRGRARPRRAGCRRHHNCPPF
jgi:hypothetical protein